MDNYKMFQMNTQGDTLSMRNKGRLKSWKHGRLWLVTHNARKWVAKSSRQADKFGVDHFQLWKWSGCIKKLGPKQKQKKKIVENRVVRKPVHEDQGLAIQETKADFLYIKINKFLPFNIFTALLRFIHFI